MYSVVKDQVATVMYTIVTPMLNPFIYSLRNKDEKGSKEIKGQNSVIERITEGMSSLGDDPRDDQVILPVYPLFTWYPKRCC